MHGGEPRGGRAVECTFRGARGRCSVWMPPLGKSSRLKPLLQEVGSPAQHACTRRRLRLRCGACIDSPSSPCFSSYRRWRRPRSRPPPCRSEEHTSELQSLMRISYAVFCLKKKTTH